MVDVLQLTDTAMTAEAINRAKIPGLKAVKRGTEMGLSGDVVVFPPASPEMTAAQLTQWKVDHDSATTRVREGGVFIYGEVRWTKPPHLHTSQEQEPNHG